MKTGNNHPSSTIPHRRYPSLSDDIGWERETLTDLPGLSGTPPPDASVRMVYLRLILVLAAMMFFAALVANT